MTRFVISLEDGVGLVWLALQDMCGGEIYVKKIPSIKVTDIASAIAPHAKQEVIGTRPGEKLHEQMIGIEDAAHTYEYDGYFKILPARLTIGPLTLNALGLARKLLTILVTPLITIQIG